MEIKILKYQLTERVNHLVLIYSDTLHGLVMSFRQSRLMQLSYTMKHAYIYEQLKTQLEIGAKQELGQ